jgi:hypothetical protein
MVGDGQAVARFGMLPSVQAGLQRVSFQSQPEPHTCDPRCNIHPVCELPFVVDKVVCQSEGRLEISFNIVISVSVGFTQSNIQRR